MEQQHRIQKYIFDIEYDSEDKAYQFQTRVSDCIKDKLLNATEEALSYVSLDKNISIKRLEIDLGEISFEDFEYDIYYKLKDQLTDKLLLLIAGFGINSIEETPEFISPSYSDLKTLQYFLEQGTLPWTSKKKDSVSYVNQLIIQLIEDKHQDVKKIIELIIQKPEVKLRIIRQLEDLVIFKIVNLFAESETVKFFKLYTDLLKIYSKQAVLKNSFIEYRELVLRFILEEVFVSIGYKKTIPELSKVFLEYISKEAGVSVERSILLFYNVLFAKPGSDLKTISDSDIVNLTVDSKWIASVADSLQLKSSFHEALIELVKKDIVQKEEDKSKKLDKPFVNSNDTSFNNKVSKEEDSEVGFNSVNGSDSIANNSEIKERKKFEEFKKEERAKRQKILIQFFAIIKSLTEIDVVLPQISRIELIIKEILATNPILLRTILADAEIDVEEFKSQFILELFSEEIVEILLRDVFNIKRNEFVRLKQKASFQVVKHFFETGIFPLGFKKADFEKIFIMVLQEEKTKVTSIINKSVLKSKNKDFKIAQIKNTFSPELIKKYFATFPEVINASTETQQDFYKAAVAVLGSKTISLSKVETAEQFVFILQNFLKFKAFPMEFKFTVSDIIKKWIDSNNEALATFLLTLKPLELQVIQQSVSVSAAELITKTITEFRASVQQVLNTPIKSEEELIKDWQVKEKEIEKKKAASLVKETERSFEFRKPKTGEPIYIANAGLVLVHPYLSRFFSLLNLLDKRAFKDEVTAHKAAHILQYLVNKSINSEEHELVLNKLVCGIDLQTPLMRDIEITEDDKLTCENLLEGVIQNWPILKNTSNDNLRASFLMREGRLVPEAMNWRLRVEERGYDILVEKIPWTISMIKLPWMKNLINVEWK